MVRTDIIPFIINYFKIVIIIKDQLIIWLRILTHSYIFFCLLCINI